MIYLNALDPSRGGPKKCGVAYGILYVHVIYSLSHHSLPVFRFFCRGFVRFLQYWYMVLISKKKKVGAIGPHYIYSITGMDFFPFVFFIFLFLSVILNAFLSFSFVLIVAVFNPIDVCYLTLAPASVKLQNSTDETRHATFVQSRALCTHPHIISRTCILIERSNGQMTVTTNHHIHIS